MKKTLLLFLVYTYAAFLNGQTVTTLTVKGEFSPTFVSSPNIIGTQSKDLHLRSSKSGQIRAIYNESEMKSFHVLAPKIINQAINKWEKKLVIPNTTVININFRTDSSLDNSTAYLANVPYIEIQNITYCAPLAQALFNYPLKKGEEVEIVINANSLLWYFEGDKDNPISANQYDFETAILRALTHSFGFISTIGGRRPAFRQPCNTYDAFLTNSNNIKLPSVSNSELSQYITSNNLYWKTANGYKIYAPATYEQGKSLNYFDSNLNELMAIEFKSQTGNRNIDSKVEQVIEDIGWKIKPGNPLSIKSNNIDNNTGIGSVYNSYSFYAQSNDVIINYSWKYQIRNNDNTYTTIKNASSSTFSISPLALNDNYYRDEYGNICGKISLTATINGNTYLAEFNIWLEATPANIDYNVEIIKESDWYYNIEMTVSSAGAEDLILTLNDYAIGESLTNVYYNHQFIKYTFKYLYYDSPVFLEFTSRNNHGSKYNTYYIDGINYYDSALRNKKNTKINVLNTKELIRKEVFSIMGDYLLTIPSNDDNEINRISLQPGIYIIKSIYNDGTSTGKKIIKE